MKVFKILQYTKKKDNLILKDLNKIIDQKKKILMIFKILMQVIK